MILAKTAHISEPRVVLIMVIASALGKLVLVLFSAGLPLNTDQSLFHLFVREMADHRLDGDVLSRLSRLYDYPVWAGRVLPVHYAIRRLAGDQDLLWARLMNVVLSTALLLVTYGFGRRLLPAGRRKWVAFLMLALPFQWFVVTDYSHHLFSSFYFLVCIWCAWELVFARPGVRCGLALSGLAALCLLLMMWQRGVHLIALAVWAALIVWAGLTGGGVRRWGWLLLWLGLIPLVVSLPLSARLDAWLARHDVHQLNSVLPAFVARGWCPESAGEYCGRYEQLDRVTPWPHKRSAMYRLVLSQIRYNPRTVVLRFPVVKTAKLFLVGYASNYEESLAAMGSRLQPWARGMRLAAAPVFLGCALLGCLGLAVSKRNQAIWLPVLLAPLLTWGAYVFLGETSPRYSIFCQPFLALLGAHGLGTLRGRAQMGRYLQPGIWREFGFRAMLVVGGVAVVLGGLVVGVHRLPDHRLYADLRSGWSGPADTSAQELPRPGAFQPFEVIWQPADDRQTRQVLWTASRHFEIDQVLSLYVLEATGAARHARLLVETGDQLHMEIPLVQITEPRYVEVDWPAGTETLSLSLVHRAADGGLGGHVAIGYLTFQDKEP